MTDRKRKIKFVDERRTQYKWNQEFNDFIICNSSTCDHKVKSKNISEFPKHLINPEKGYKLTLNDLIGLAECYHCVEQTKYRSLCLKKLSDLKLDLIKLENMIGLKDIKQRIVSNIIKFLLKIKSDNNLESLHTIIGGPPGVGKSTFVHILASIYLKLGLLTRGHVVNAKATDLIGKYVGHTAAMTQDKIDEAYGGILLIDEFYTLGANYKNSFSKECIDTLNRNMTENKNWILFGAGYINQIVSDILDKNEGIKSRFKYFYVINPYSSMELKEIFKRHIKDINYVKWKIDIPEEDLDKFFEKIIKSLLRSVEMLKNYLTILLLYMLIE